VAPGCCGDTTLAQSGEERPALGHGRRWCDHGRVSLASLLRLTSLVELALQGEVAGVIVQGE